MSNRIEYTYRKDVSPADQLERDTIARITNHAYHEARDEAIKIHKIHYKHSHLVEHGAKAHYGKRALKQNHVDKIERAKETITQIYLEKLNKLPTETIIKIIECHDRGLILRMDRTLESLKNELFRRDLLGDSGENNER